MAEQGAQQGAEMGFGGFRPAAFAFFEGLAANQSRDWFIANKAVYEAEVVRPLGALVDSLALAFAARGVPLTGDSKRSLFRIHRDVRFSKDKRPYKTNASAVMSRDGAKITNGVLYFHLEGPDRAFVALGFYNPDPPALAAIRQAIVDRPERWRETETHLARHDLSLSQEGAAVRMPRGLEGFAGSPLAATLKLKGFTVSRAIATPDLFRPGLVDNVAAFAKAGLPLLEFGWAAIGQGSRD